MGAANTIICPVRLLLVLALRLREVEERTWADLESRYKGPCAGQPVKFKNPERPVLGRLGGEASYSEPTIPVGVRDVQRALSRGAVLLGIPDVLRTHDNRRGAAGGVYYVANKAPRRQGRPLKWSKITLGTLTPLDEVALQGDMWGTTTISKTRRRLDHPLRPPRARQDDSPS
ncbi:hypothetical protein IMZ48_27805, partial [Candidatus Bathyarchaeota archaeon]|nr:hypothetical protein [Candidatus Bathyarchaeota archaeon]